MARFWGQPVVAKSLLAVTEKKNTVVLASVHKCVCDQKSLADLLSTEHF